MHKVWVMLLLTLCHFAAVAEVVIGNLPPVNSSFNSQFGPGAGDRRHAVSFTMPDVSGYLVDAVVLDLSCIECPLDVFVTLQGDAAGEPDETPQATFESVTINGSEVTVLMLADSFFLQPNTTYWLVVDGSTRGLWRANNAGNFPSSEIGATFGAQMSYQPSSWEPTTANPDFAYNVEISAVFDLIFASGFEVLD